MFKLHRQRSDRSGEKLDFRLSQFQAFQVPQGWDKLFVSVISVETGKTIAKSSKAVVHGGTCQWTETFSESIWVSQDDASKELAESLLKIVVSMGSARSGILGEVVINLIDYVSSRDSGPLSLPLKKCNYGTFIQVRIQCLPPRTKSRDGKSWMKRTSFFEDAIIDNEDMDNKSDGSDNMSKKSGGSFSASHLAGTSYPEEQGNRETSFSTSGSHRSSDSGDSYIGRTNFSPKSSVNGGAYNHVGRQDSTGSHNGAIYGPGPADEISRSNHSSFNSRASGSSFNTNQWQDMSAQASAHGLPLRTSDSSKDLIEVAEETIDELRDEAKMWERHARKLKLDLEILKKESSDKFKHQADLDMELSAAYAERDSLKQELEQLNILLEELKTKQTTTDTVKIENIKRMQKELEDELKFQKESNANLTLQLKKTQESNVEFVSILQELEEIIEKQREEIANFSIKSQAVEAEGGMDQKLLDMEAEWAHKFSAKEEEVIKLEGKLYDALNAKRSNEVQCTDNHSESVEEIEVLRAKVQELEKDCAELTDENLDLIFKMKELRQDTGEGKGFRGSIDNDSNCHISPVSSESLTLQFNALEKKYSSLELELQHYKDQACDLDTKLRETRAEVEDKNKKLSELQEECESYQGINMRNSDIVTGEFKQRSSTEMSRLLSEINKQIHLALTHVKYLYDAGHSEANSNTRCSSSVDSTDSCTDEGTQEEQAESMINSLLELNDILSANATEFKSIFREQSSKVVLNDNTISREFNYASEVSHENLSDVEELKVTHSMQEEKIDALRNSKKELEEMISTLEKEKCQLERSLEIAKRENSITSKCLDDVQHDFMVLTSSTESQVSANKILERKLMELESSKNELELNVSELEQENVQLSERISGLEAQLRYLTDEKESGRLALENSRSLVMDLKNEISKQQAEIETQKVELKQKLEETQKRLSEVQEESEVLRRSNSKLQATAEKLIEECTSLQKLNGDLKKQKLEYHEYSTHLEVELKESQSKNLDFSKKVELLEAKVSSLHKDIMSKESLLISQLESIFQEHKEHEEKLSQAHIMLNKVDLEKEVELRNLQKELDHLTAQMSSSQDEREKMASDAVREAVSLRSDNAKLESSLQDANAKIKLQEAELFNLRRESGNKVQGLVDLLNASKQSEEMLMTDIDRMQSLMEDVKSSEEKFKKLANELEVRLKASDYEKQQINDEILSLKVQLQKTAQLQDELVTLKSSLDDAKFEIGKLEELLKKVSEECEKLKTEKISFIEKISDMQKALDDVEDDRYSKIALEEKLVRLECDLTAREASYAHEAELKNELKRMKRTNSEYRRKIQCLEDEKDELMRKADLNDKELGVTKDPNQDVKVSSGEDDIVHKGVGSPRLPKENDLSSKVCILETELAEALEANNMYKVQLQRLLSEKQNSPTEDLGESISGNNLRSDEVDRISQLEAELKDMQERYLQMSLQYAEVEAQREEMVMKLKTVKKEKKWFS